MNIIDILNMIWVLSVTACLIYFSFCISKLIEILKLAAKVNDNMIKEFKDINEKIEALEKYLGVEFKERTMKLSLPDIEIKKSTDDIQIGEMKKTITEAHYAPKAVEKKTTILLPKREAKRQAKIDEILKKVGKIIRIDGNVATVVEYKDKK